MSTDSESLLSPPPATPGPATQAFEDSPHPFRFGLKALMLLMACCGVLFSLMSYLGMLPGLLVGLAACYLVLLALVFTAMIYWRGSGTPLMHRLDQLAIRLVVAIPLIAMGAFVAGGGKAIYDQTTYWRQARRIHGELGITANQQNIMQNNRMRYALLVTDVAHGGPFDQAGGQPGDIILCDHGVQRFYEMIEDNRGKEVTLTVVDGAAMKPVEDSTMRTIDVLVPP